MARPKAITLRFSNTVTLHFTHTGQEGQPAAGAASHGLHITVVRRVLQADGWKIKPAGDFLSDSEDEDE